jgi:hypothetical protein
MQNGSGKVVAKQTIGAERRIEDERLADFAAIAVTRGWILKAVKVDYRHPPTSRAIPANWQIDQKSEKGVFRRGHQKTGAAGFTPHTMIDAAGLAVDEIAGI